MSDDDDDQDAAHSRSRGELILREAELRVEPHPVGYMESEGDMSQLHVLIEALEWDAVEERLKSHPQEIRGQSSTALHYALEGGECPMKLIRTMIEMDPMLPATLDHNQNTPLHIACAGTFAYDPMILLILVVAYPQALLVQDKIERTTPLHMLLVLGGDINMTCLRLILDVAYSAVAGLSEAFVLALEFLVSPLEASVVIAQHFPPLVAHLAREMATCDPYGFPAFLRPFLHLAAPERLVVPPRPMPGQRKILLVRDGMMQVPLHIAARQCLRREVVELLLKEEQYPGAHAACSVLERKDRAPLHYSALYGAPMDSSECIFEINKDVIHAYEEYGMTPYIASANRPHFTLEERALELKAHRRSPSEPMPDLLAKSRSWIYYEQLEFYLRLTYRGSLQEDGYSVVHAASAVVSPPHFLRCSIGLNPWQLEERDASGNLPLHLACKVLRPLGIHEHLYWMKEDIEYDKMHFRLIPEQRARDNPITILVEAWGGAASVLDRDGDLPIHSAIASGKKMVDGVRSLVRAAPMGLCTRSMTRGLYPFMLAATVDDADLTLDLLLANPSVLRMVGPAPTAADQHPPPPPRLEKRRRSCKY